MWSLWSIKKKLILIINLICCYNFIDRMVKALLLVRIIVSNLRDCSIVLWFLWEVRVATNLPFDLSIIIIKWSKVERNGDEMGLIQTTTLAWPTAIWNVSVRVFALSSSPATIGWPLASSIVGDLYNFFVIHRKKVCLKLKSFSSSKC